METSYLNWFGSIARGEITPLCKTNKPPNPHEWGDRIGTRPFLVPPFMGVRGPEVSVLQGGGVSVLLLFMALSSTSAFAQPPIPTAPATIRTTPIGFPQDAGPHDASVIEWWYFNSFFTTASGKHYSIVGSFFRTGLTPTRKGHYLIYSLTDLDTKKRAAYSVLDKGSVALLKAYTSLAAAQNPEDKRAMAFLGQLQRNELPKPHRVLPASAKLTTKPRFALSMGENRIAQATADGRTWKATLKGDDFTVNLTLAQPTRPAMLVGGDGKTGVTNPDDMYYLTLSRMETTGTLTRSGVAGVVTEKFTGTGWLDRQWGQSWGVNPNVGWDWFGLRLEDGSDILVYRLRNTRSGKTIQAEATIIDKDGKQTVDKEVVIAPTTDSTKTTTDPLSGVVYPTAFTLQIPSLKVNYTISADIEDQTIPVLTPGGDSIWEGIVSVYTAGVGNSTRIGKGYMELVGYKSAAAANQPPASK
jgi:predicted secreted hydrolase